MLLRVWAIRRANSTDKRGLCSTLSFFATGALCALYWIWRFVRGVFRCALYTLGNFISRAGCKIVGIPNPRLLPASRGAPPGPHRRFGRSPGMQPSSWLHERPYSPGQRQRRWRKNGETQSSLRLETPFLPPRPLVFVAEFSEFLLDDVAFVALDFDDAVFDRAAAAAFLFQ